MTSTEIRKRFLDFFEKHRHVIVPSSSLVPDDPSVLLTTAGMQQFKPYYTGKADPLKDFGSQNTTSIQKSFRTSDIDEVGDESHLTFFEMMGNFSFGGYMKKEAISYAYEFLTKEMNLKISYVTIFEGSLGVPKDEESRQIWESLGIVDIREEGIEDVFWGPTGSSGPCGPTTEIYCKNGVGKDIEVWNIVFNQFFYSGSREELLAGSFKKKLEPLVSPGVDTGMGLERLAMVVQKTETVFETDLFGPLLDRISGDVPVRKKRILADHARSAAFLIADGVRPSNKEQGYILRRLLRRMYAYKKHSRHAGLPQIHNERVPRMLQTDILISMIQKVVDDYSDFYKELNNHRTVILECVKEEWSKFETIIDKGLAQAMRWQWDEITPQTVFSLYQSDGLPYEVMRDFIEEASGKQFPVTYQDFEREFRKHQEISRAGTEKKFGGHGLLLDTGELKAANEDELGKVTRLHTATHLLQAALRKVLGDEVKQMGSDITAERTRFDFSFPRKVTKEELSRIEELVSEAIRRDLVMEAKKMPYHEAVKTGALYFFKEKYPDEVHVYSAYDPKSGEVFSREFCGGPHVQHTGEIGVFKILKEESSSAGVRRIRATIK